MNQEKIQTKFNSVVNSSNAKTAAMIVLVSVIVIGYIFFFLSTRIIGEDYDFTIAEIGNVVTLENGHTVKLTRSDVDFERNLIEYEFYFQNSNYDGCNDYDVAIKTSSKNGKIATLQTETVCSDSDVYVVRANLPKKWNAVVADVTVKNKDNNILEAKFYETVDTVYSTKISDNSSREYFLKLDTSRSIEILSDSIEDVMQENSDLDKKVKEIDTNVSNLQNRLSYMTADELAQAQSEIENMISERETALKQIDNNKKLITEYQNNITDLQEKLNQQEAADDEG